MKQKVLAKSGAKKVHKQRVGKLKPFSSALYRLISRIPKGKVVTYGEVARILDSHPRAVGQALRRNPYCPSVPCHRIVAATRALHGFSGHMDTLGPYLKRKQELLEEEGVVISKSTVDQANMFTFDKATVSDILHDYEEGKIVIDDAWSLTPRGFLPNI